MARDSRYDILFEPVAIGPTAAPNRFYAVPHASGMTNANAADPGGLPRDQGRGRLGCRLHRRLLDPPQRRRPAVAQCDAVGRGRHPQPCADDGGGAPPRGAGRRRAVAWRRLVDEPHQPPAAAVAIRHSVDGDACRFMGNLRPQDDGQERHPRRAALAGRERRAQGARRPASTSSMSMPAWAICRYEFLLAGIQPAQRRIWRLDREPRAASCGR